MLACDIICKSPVRNAVLAMHPGPVVQLVRTLACHARGRGFESHPGRQSCFCKDFASVAQLVEQGTENPRVVGSIPTGGTIYADLAHLVERNLAKVEVAGSSPVIRSIRKTEGRVQLFLFSFSERRQKVKRIPCWANFDQIRYPTPISFTDKRTKGDTWYGYPIS